VVTLEGGYNTEMLFEQAVCVAIGIVIGLCITIFILLVQHLMGN